MTTTRRLNDSNKVIVTAALTGAVTTKQDNPYLPTQPKEIAEAALRCYEAGAAMVHIHVRDDNDAGSMRFDKFEEAVGLIRATGCPVLLNLTSSGGQGFSWEERIRPFRELRPEMASFDELASQCGIYERTQVPGTVRPGDARRRSQAGD